MVPVMTSALQTHPYAISGAGRTTFSTGRTASCRSLTAFCADLAAPGAGLSFSCTGPSTLTGSRPGSSNPGDAALPGFLTHPKPSGAALPSPASGPPAVAGTALGARAGESACQGWHDPKGSCSVHKHVLTTRTTARTAVEAAP